MKILVTGAAGFIGSHLAEALLSAGHQVIGLDNFNPYYDRDIKERNAASVRAAGGRVVEADLAVDELDEYLEGVSAVFTAAAQPGLSAATSDADYERNNVLATRRLIEAASRQDESPMLLYLSTSSVYGAVATGGEEVEPQPTSNYGRTKLAAERIVLAASSDGRLKSCSLRIFSVYGPRERPEKLFPLLIQCIDSGTSFPLFEGSMRHVRSFTYVGDIVAGLLRALERREQLNGEIINLGSEQTSTTEQGIRLVEGFMGKPARLEICPPRPGDQVTTQAKLEKARRLLDFVPKTTLSEGLRSEVAWFRGDEG